MRNGFSAFKKLNTRSAPPIYTSITTDEALYIRFMSTGDKFATDKNCCQTNEWMLSITGISYSNNQIRKQFIFHGFNFHRNRMRNSLAMNSQWQSDGKWIFGRFSQCKHIAQHCDVLFCSQQFCELSVCLVGQVIFRSASKIEQITTIKILSQFPFFVFILHHVFVFRFVFDKSLRLVSSPTVYTAHTSVMLTVHTTEINLVEVLGQ